MPDSKNALRSLVATAVLALAALAPAAGRVGAEGAPAADAQKVKLVRQLISMTGSDRVGEQVMQALIAQFRQTFTNVPAEYWNGLGSKVQIDELLDQIVPLYTKHFSEAELKELIAFYDSPVGKKVIATLPAIAQESMLVGQTWGQKKAAEILARLKADGYEPSPSATPTK